VSTQNTKRRALMNTVMNILVELKARIFHMLNDYQSASQKGLCSVPVVQSCLVYSYTENY
jgi:hypothetical protein